MFISDDLALPDRWRRSSQVNLSHPKSRNPLFGKLVKPRRLAPRRTTLPMA